MSIFPVFLFSLLHATTYTKKVLDVSMRWQSPAVTALFINDVQQKAVWGTLFIAHVEYYQQLNGLIIIYSVKQSLLTEPSISLKSSKSWLIMCCILSLPLFVMKWSICISYKLPHCWLLTCKSFCFIVQSMGPGSLMFIRNLLDKLTTNQQNILKFIACNEIFLMPATVFMLFRFWRRWSLLKYFLLPCIYIIC